MKAWITDMVVRAVKTLIQAFVGCLVAVNAVDEINWYIVIVTSFGACAMSLITSICNHYGLSDEQIEEIEEEDSDE